MMKRFLRQGAFGTMALAMVLTVAPLATRADDSSSAAATRSATDEFVVTSPTDTPLVRQAKLSRSWTVFREASSTQIWAITKDKMKREIQTLDFFTAFNANYRIQLVAPGRLDEFTAGDPIASTDGLNPDDFLKAAPMCRLEKTADNPAVYLVCGNMRRVILREGVFHQFGWEFRDVETVPQDQLNALQEDTPLDEQTTFNEDVEVKTTQDRQLRDQLNQRLDLQGKQEVRARLVKSVDHPEVFVITPDGKKHHIANMDAVIAHGLDLKNVTEVTDDELAAFPEGAPIGADPSQKAILNQHVTPSVEDVPDMMPPEDASAHQETSAPAADTASHDTATQTETPSTDTGTHDASPAATAGTEPSTASGDHMTPDTVTNTGENGAG